MTPAQRYQLDRALLAIREAERGPTPEELAAAPRLDIWRPMLDQRRMAALWGEVSGHPKLGGDLITTSRLVAIDREKGWARTVSRWYHLGIPFAAFEAELARKMGQESAKAGFFGFEPTGFTPVDDPQLLDQILAAYVALVRKIEAGYAAAPPRRDGTCGRKSHRHVGDDA